MASNLMRVPSPSRKFSFTPIRSCRASRSLSGRSDLTIGLGFGLFVASRGLADAVVLVGFEDDATDCRGETSPTIASRRFLVMGGGFCSPSRQLDKCSRTKVQTYKLYIPEMSALRLILARVVASVSRSEWTYTATSVSTYSKLPFASCLEGTPMDSVDSAETFIFLRDVRISPARSAPANHHNRISRRPLAAMIEYTFPLWRFLM